MESTDNSPAPAEMPADAGFREGFLLGILVGEGHFGGDGKQPHVTLRMHTRHAELFNWIQRHFPGGRVYGPYLHGGRNYLQWMARGALKWGETITHRLRPEEAPEFYHKIKRGDIKNALGAVIRWNIG